MTTEQVERMRQVLRDIAQDMEADAARFDGQPFTGRTVAEYFGNQGAAIAALANVASTLLDELAEGVLMPTVAAEAAELERRR